MRNHDPTTCLRTEGELLFCQPCGLEAGGGVILYSQLPTLNACLNALTTVLILTGFVLIRKKQVTLHRLCMLSAVFTSALFLVSYITYHLQTLRPTPFQGQGWVRSLYFSILISHSILAVLIVPLVLRTLYLAIRGRFQEHRRIAQWTFPIWLYVSITGVVIYEMLY